MMFVMTAKMDLKKILIILAVAALLIVALVAVFGGAEQTASTGTAAVSGMILQPVREGTLYMITGLVAASATAV